MNARSLAVVVLVAMAFGARCAVARADGGGPDPEAAVLFQEAKELMDQGRFAEACPKLERSRRLDAQVGTTLNLAFCYERLGKTASSWALWLDGASEAALKDQRDRERLARLRAARLEPQLLRITIRLTPQTGLEAIDLQLDGVSIVRSRWGAPIPVDRGSHWVQATAEGRRPWVVAIEVDDQHVPTVNVGVLERLPQATGEVLLASPRPFGARRTAAVVLGSTGVAAIAGMSALALVADSTYRHALCSGTQCLKSGVDDRHQASVEAGFATAAGVVGVAALTGAVVLWFGSAQAQSGLAVRPFVGRQSWGISVQGAAW